MFQKFFTKSKMAKTDYPFSNSPHHICSISTILVILNINRADADLESIKRKVSQLLKKNKLKDCKTLKGSLDRLLTYYYRNEASLPSLQDISLYSQDIIDLTIDD